MCKTSRYIPVTRSFNKFLLITAFFLLFYDSHVVFAEPGIVQVATRQGFWTNEFPDKLIILQHYRHVDGEINLPSGSENYQQHLSLTRFINTWHFGDDNQYQYLLQGVLPLTSFNFGGTSLSGMADPLIYTSIGWNNHAKTDHVTLFSITRVPFGDEELSTDAFANITGLAYERKWTRFMFEVSAGYWAEFDKEGTDTAKGKNYWEFNAIASYKWNSRFSFYNQWDYKITDESEVLGVKQDDDGYNYGTAIGVGYIVAPRFQIDAKAYTDLGNNDEQIEEDLTFNIRFAVIFD